jgi:hypothetical protein
MEFKTVEDYEAAKNYLEKMMYENHVVSQKAKYLVEQVEEREASLNHWQKSLEEETKKYEMNQMELKTAAVRNANEKHNNERAAALLQIANQDPLQVIEEILVLLEVEEDPAAIAKFIRAKREQLSPQW